MSAIPAAAAPAPKQTSLYMFELREMTAIWSILDPKSLVQLLSQSRPDYSASEVQRLVTAADEILTTLVPLHAPPAVQRAFLAELDGMNRFAGRLRYQSSAAARAANRKQKKAAAAPPAVEKTAAALAQEEEDEAERVIMMPPAAAPITTTIARRLAEQARLQKHKAAFAATSAKKPPTPLPESSKSESSESSESESSESESSESESSESESSESESSESESSESDAMMPPAAPIITTIARRLAEQARRQKASFDASESESPPVKKAKKN